MARRALYCIVVVRRFMLPFNFVANCFLLVVEPKMKPTEKGFFALRLDAQIVGKLVLRVRMLIMNHFGVRVMLILG